MTEEFAKILSTFSFIGKKGKILVIDDLSSETKDYFNPKQTIVRTNSDGSQTVLLTNEKIKEVLLKESDYRLIRELSNISKNNKVYFYTFLNGSDAPPGGIYEFDIQSSNFRKLPLISKYYSNYGNKSVSPDGRYIATMEDPNNSSERQKIFLLDLERDTVKIIVQLSKNEVVTFCSSKGDCWGNSGELKWIKENTLEYGVYDSTKFISENFPFDYPLIEKRQVKI